MIRKYTRRWLLEKGISEQIEFFHLNRVSSLMVIKVDFDLTMSILAHNILRLLAMDLPGYSHNTDFSLIGGPLPGLKLISFSEIMKLPSKQNLPN